MWKHVCALLLIALVTAQAHHIHHGRLEKAMGHHFDHDRLEKVKHVIEKLHSRDRHSTRLVRRDAELSPMAYEEQIKAFLEQLKEMMREPIDAFGLPALDPLEIAGPINIDIASDLIELLGSVSNIRVDNLSRFETVSASFSIVGFKLSVEVFFEEIVASGNYDLDGSLMSGLLLVYGEGPFTVSIRNASLSADIAIKSTDSVPYIDTLTIDYNIPIVQTNFSGLLGGGDLSDVTNEIISDLVPEILDSAKETILGAIVPRIVEVANGALSAYTFNDLICLIVGLFCS